MWRTVHSRIFVYIILINISFGLEWYISFTPPCPFSILDVCVCVCVCAFMCACVFAYLPVYPRLPAARRSIFYKYNSLRTLLPKIWYSDARCHEANRCTNWACLADVYAFQGTLKISIPDPNRDWGTAVWRNKIRARKLVLDVMCPETSYFLISPCLATARVLWSGLA